MWNEFKKRKGFLIGETLDPPNSKKSNAMEVDQEGNHECTPPPEEYLGVSRQVTLSNSKEDERKRKHSSISQEKEDTPEHSSIPQEEEDTPELTGPLWCHEAQQQLFEEVKRHAERFAPGWTVTKEDMPRVMEVWTELCAASPANRCPVTGREVQKL